MEVQASAQNLLSDITEYVEMSEEAKVAALAKRELPYYHLPTIAQMEVVVSEAAIVAEEATPLGRVKKKIDGV